MSSMKEKQFPFFFDFFFRLFFSFFGSFISSLLTLWLVVVAERKKMRMKGKCSCYWNESNMGKSRSSKTLLSMNTQSKLTLTVHLSTLTFLMKTLDYIINGFYPIYFIFSFFTFSLPSCSIFFLLLHIFSLYWHFVIIIIPLILLCKLIPLLL